MEGYIEAVTWSTPEQQSILHKFPEVVMMDGTYKVNNMAMPLYTLAIVDCNGIGQPVMHSLVDREDQIHLEMILEDIRCWTGDLLKSATFVIDKDYAEISAIKTVFPKSRILLCRFHIVKAFVLELKKLPVSESEQDLIYEKIQSMVYGNQAQCEDAINFVKNAFPNFYAYLERNWLSIGEMFFGYQRNGVMHLDNHTNNRLERYHRSLKAVTATSRISPGILIEKLISLDRVIYSKILHSDFDQRLKTRKDVPDALKEYSDKVSSFCLNLIVEQYFLMKKNEYDVKEDLENRFLVKNTHSEYNVFKNACNCGFSTGFGLLCRHIMCVLQFLQKSIFDLELVNKRLLIHKWHTPKTKSCHIPSKNMSSVSFAPVKERVLTYTQRYQTVMSYLQPIASILADLPPSSFVSALEWVKTLENHSRTTQWMSTNPNIQSNDSTDLNIRNSSEIVIQDDVLGPDDIEERFDFSIHQKESEQCKEEPNEHEIQGKEIDQIKNDKTPTKSFSQPTLLLKPIVRKSSGRPLNLKQRLFYHAPKKYEKLRPIDRQILTLRWLVSDDDANKAINLCSKLSTTSLKSVVDMRAADPRVDIHHFKQFFDDSAWMALENQIKNLNNVRRCCALCHQEDDLATAIVGKKKKLLASMR
nr:uncharacterized protein LOC100205365 isoform X3 [Hydra vulgaris]